jgi:hypothetical protein
MPRLAVVSTCAIEEHSEVIMDLGKAHWAMSKRELDKAKTVHELNTELNKLMNEVEILESDANPLIMQHREARTQCVEARKMAVQCYDAWERASRADNVDLGRQLPLYQPGTLPSTLLDLIRDKLHSMPTLTLNPRALAVPSSDESNSEEEVEVVDEDEEDDEEEEDAEEVEQMEGFRDDTLRAHELFTQCQQLIWEDDGFRPMRPSDDESGKQWVENEKCIEYQQINEKFGNEVAHVVRDAWLEHVTFASYANSKRIAWHAEKARPMTIPEIVATLAVAAMKHAGLSKPLRPRHSSRRHTTGDGGGEDDSDDDDESDDDDDDDGRDRSLISRAWEAYGEVTTAVVMEEPSKGKEVGGKSKAGPSKGEVGGERASPKRPRLT